MEKEKTKKSLSLSPKALSFLKLPVVSDFNLERIKVIENVLVVLGSCQLFFIDLSSMFIKEVILPIEGYWNLFWIPSQNCLVVTGRPYVVGYSLDGVRLFSFQNVHHSVAAPEITLISIVQRPILTS